MITSKRLRAIASVGQHPASSRPMFYLGHIMLGILFVLSMALVQQLIILDLEWRTLTFKVLFIPCLVGTIFGSCVAHLRLKQWHLSHQLNEKSTSHQAHGRTSINDYRLDTVSRLRIYGVYISIASLGIVIFASLQMTISLQMDTSQLRPFHYAVPLIVGSLFGYLIASNSILHQQLHNTLNIILDHDQALNREIEERKQVEQSLRDKGQELSTLNNELESYNYTLSHDLRAPVRAVTGFSQILLEDYTAQLDSTATDYLQRIHAAGLQMHRLIDGLLELAKITHGHISVATVNLSEIVQQIIEELRLSHPDTKIDVHIAPNIMATGDQRLLYSLMSNLLSNAWKYTAKAAHPRIEFGSLRSGSQPISYFVRDNGIGFDSKDRETIFEGFQRTHNSAGYEGIGIGLATVQRIIERHGGNIWAKAIPNQGASFYFTLAENNGATNTPIPQG